MGNSLCPFLFMLLLQFDSLSDPDNDFIVCVCVYHKVFAIVLRMWTTQTMINLVTGYDLMHFF